MPATQRGIYHNLKESKYVASNGEVTFYFSSTLYLNKFLDGYKDHRQKFTSSLEKNTVDNPLNMDTLADIQFYQFIEKRGFFSKLKGVNISWQDLHKYALRKMTEPNTPDWLKTQKPKLTAR